MSLLQDKQEMIDDKIRDHQIALVLHHFAEIINFCEEKVAMHEIRLRSIDSKIKGLTETPTS